jgi:hypothetical protein
MRTLPAHLLDGLQAGDNVLLLCPRFEPAETAACTDLLTVEGTSDEQILYVSFTRSPDDYREAWHRHADAAPERVTIIDARGDTRSARGSTDSVADPATDGGFVSALLRVDSPGDLTTIGVRATACLNAWEAADEDARPLVCFDSISTLLQYADTDRALEFLDTLAGRFADEDAIAHYHADPVAHDENTIETMANIFDTVCEYENDEWTYRG